MIFGEVCAFCKQDTLKERRYVCKACEAKSFAQLFYSPEKKPETPELPGIEPLLF